MSPFLAPVFAQLITLGVQDRTEARYLAAEEDYFEGATTPGASLTLVWPRYEVGLGYEASLLLTPLESKPRDLLVFHSARLGGSYRHHRTRLSLSTGVGFGDVNFQVDPLRARVPQPGDADVTPEPEPDPNAPTPSDPPDPAPSDPSMSPTQNPGAMTPGEPLQPRVVNRVVRYGTWDTSAQLTHEPTRELTLAAFASYVVGGGLDAAAREDYPVSRGTTVGASAGHRFALSSRDFFDTGLMLQASWSSIGDRAYLLTANETYSHVFTRSTSGFMGAGLSITRFVHDEGLEGFSVFPNFSVGISYTTRLARGIFNATLSGYSAPALDPLRARVDPQLGALGSLGWSRERFFSALTGSAAVSLAPADNDAGAFDSRQASFIMGYRIAEWLSVDAGGRVAEQEFQDVTTIPLSYAAFVGLNLGYAVPLYRAR